MSSLFSQAKAKLSRWAGNLRNSGSNTTTNTADAAQSSSPLSMRQSNNNNNGGDGNNGDSSWPGSPNHNSQAHYHSSDRNSADALPSAANSGLVSPSKLAEFDKVIGAPTVDVAALRNLCWCGIPDASRRFDAWCIMLRYVPSQVAATGAAVLQRKRSEYARFVDQHHSNVPWDDLLGSQSTQGVGGSSHSLATGNFDTSQGDINVMRQIRKDVPRTFGGVLMLQHVRAQLLLERVLFIWALRHPASGYVQGMNDILLPFLFVVLSKKISSDGDIDRLLNLTEADVKAVSGTMRESDWLEVEADAYWLLSSFMSSVQSNFTFSQGGTHALVKRMQRVISLADPALNQFLIESGVSFEEFAFRWMNCFLLRELPPRLGVRLFDTYCAEEVDGGKGFGTFHVYVCAALLLRWSETLRRATDYAEVVQLLQKPQTKDYTDATIGELTAQAYVLLQQYGSRVDLAKS